MHRRDSLCRHTARETGHSEERYEEQKSTMTDQACLEWVRSGDGKAREDGVESLSAEAARAIANRQVGDETSKAET